MKVALFWVREECCCPYVSMTMLAQNCWLGTNRTTALCPKITIPRGEELTASFAKESLGPLQLIKCEEQKHGMKRYSGFMANTQKVKGFIPATRCVAYIVYRPASPILQLSASPYIQLFPCRCAHLTDLDCVHLLHTNRNAGQQTHGTRVADAT
jgi:hypothetical protein